MQVGQRPPIAPKPRSMVLPVSQQYESAHYQQQLSSSGGGGGGSSNGGGAQTQAGAGRTYQESRTTMVPRLKRGNIPPPPASPPPPLPAPRSASLRGGARLSTYLDRESCHYECSAPGGEVPGSEAISTAHYDSMVVDDLPAACSTAGSVRRGSGSSGYGNSGSNNGSSNSGSNNGSNDSIYGNAAGGGDRGPRDNAGSPPRQPDLRNPAHHDSYVAFIPPGTGTLKRRLCRTASRAQKPTIGTINPVQRALQSAASGHYEEQSSQTASSQSTEYYSNGEVLKDGASTGGMHGVVRPSVVAPQRGFLETKAKMASVLGSIVANPRPPPPTPPPPPPPPPSPPPPHRAEQNPAFPIVSLPSESRPRSMSTSTWRRGQAPAHCPQSCSMSMRVRSAVIAPPPPPSPHSGAPPHPLRRHHAVATPHAEEAPPPYDNDNDNNDDDDDDFPAPPPLPLLPRGYAPGGSRHDLRANDLRAARITACRSPAAHSSSGGDSDYERISPRGSFIEQLLSGERAGRRDSVYSSVSESSEASASSYMGGGGDLARRRQHHQQQQQQQQQAQFFNAWEQYLRGTNPCGGGGSGDAGSSSSSESDADETENCDYSSDEGAVMDVVGELAAGGAAPSPRPVPTARRTFSQATPPPAQPPCPASTSDDANCRLTRNNAIRRGPRSSARGEALRSALLMPPADMTPSLPSLLSESSKESLAEEVTTTERLCDDCRFWKKMEFRDLDMNAAVCSACQAHRRKRTRVVAELVATEEKYGHNLNIVKEVFMEPMLNGLVPAEFCQKIFLNLQELIDLNSTLCNALKHQVDEVSKKADWEEAGHRIVIGKAFAEHLPSMKAFEVYCVNQASSARALGHYSKKSSLFKVFLQVCQNDDDRCASMPLPAFLIAPLQRVTRYPLLLANILSHTPQRHPDYAPLSDCLKQLEVLLDKINSESVIPGPNNKSSVQSKPSAAKELLSNKSVDELLLFALSKVGWSPEEADLLYHGPLEIQTQQRSSRKSASSSTSRSAVKTTVTCAVLVQLKHPGPFQIENPQFAGRFKLGASSGNTKPHLVLVGVNKNGDMICEKDPLALEKCVVAKPASDFEGGSSCFDISQMTDHSSLILKAPGPHSRDQWLECLSQATRSAGLWRQRRRGLPNIMIFENCQR